MYVGLKNIRNLFKEYPSLLTKSDATHCLTSWNRYTQVSDVYASHILYVMEQDDPIPDADSTIDLHFLYILKKGTDANEFAKRFPDNISLLLVTCDDPSEIYNKLQLYYNHQCGTGMYGQSLLEFLAFEDGLQSAIDYSYGVFMNPIYVFDTNYNLIAATWKQIEQLGIQDDVIVNKRFSPDDFKMINRDNNLHSRVLKSEIPVKAFNASLGYEQMYCAINTQKNFGHIVVSAVNKPFEPIDTEFMLLLKKYVDQQLKKDSFIKNAKGFNYEYFLRDLLDEKITAGTGGSDHMKFTGNMFSGNMYCMVIETARSASMVNINHVRNITENRFPYSKTLVYNGQIISILSFQGNQFISDEYINAGQKICLDNDLYAGLSNCFQDILDLKEYYSQALRAIEYGTQEHNQPALYQYADYYLSHVTSLFLQKESARTFCHPKMQLLLDYDKSHKSELAYTLYMYLVHERNLAATAEAMDMHRTSLVYRFKKINSLIEDTFDNYKDRLYMILSYEMNR